MDYLNFLHGGGIYEVKRRYRKEVIDFSANINPLGLPLKLKQAIYRNLNRILHYPDPLSRDITKKIAKFWDIDGENILVGNGSVEFIYLIMSTFKPKTTLIPVPTFSEYERAAKSVKSRVGFLILKEKEGFKFTPENVQGRADISFLCNPNNPTGNLVFENRRAVEKLDTKLLVIDEAFMDFLPNQKDYTLIWRAVRDEKIAVLRTFTKFFGIPGLRIGYIVAHKRVINKLKEHQPPWSTNSLAQIAAELILKDEKYINKTFKLIEKERGFLYRELSRINGLRLFPSVTNFILIKKETPGITSKSLKGLLIKKGILIRDCSNFRNLNDRYIRVAVRSRRENQKLLVALREII